MAFTCVMCYGTENRYKRFMNPHPCKCATKVHWSCFSDHRVTNNKCHTCNTVYTMKVIDDGCLKEDLGTIIHRIYYKSGALKEEGTSVNYLRHGIWKTYYESGALKEECNYVYASLDGPKKIYKESDSI